MCTIVKMCPSVDIQIATLLEASLQTSRTIYLFYLNLVDVTLKYKATVPIGVALRGPAKSIKNIQGILTSTTIVKYLEKIYDDPENPLIWPKEFLSDKGSEFKSECKKLLRKHGIEIQKAKSKKTMDSSSNIIELEDLPSVIDSIIENLNNSVIRLLGITPATVIKKKSVFAKPSKARKGSMGYNEKRLSYGNSVLHLLDPSEYEGGRRCATDMNWSSKIYNIRESLIQKNQPVLYWLMDDEGNDPERFLVREELQVIPPDVEYPP
ncbi:hypothetical protein RCL_jg7027.t1 [Rhizophagus clarus]|uniref:Integrase catalytic domain-containing protein n=1 Tax=Rhizophagus clarus TaxID=94130 RepID=A0A8H3QZE7_9GLOM|nr:hypothetical protein RCL_jg7027.t1 [Rhizophagus clarus]